MVSLPLLHKKVKLYVDYQKRSDEMLIDNDVDRGRSVSNPNECMEEDDDDWSSNVIGCEGDTEGEIDGNIEREDKEDPDYKTEEWSQS